jgi:hypothetical protein
MSDLSADSELRVREIKTVLLEAGTDEDRREIMNEVLQDFCRECWRQLGEFEHCNCWNDE